MINLGKRRTTDHLRMACLDMASRKAVDVWCDAALLIDDVNSLMPGVTELRGRRETKKKTPTSISRLDSACACIILEPRQWSQLVEVVDTVVMRRCQM